MSGWESTFKSLEIPSKYTRLQGLDDDVDAFGSLDAWRNSTRLALGAILELLVEQRGTGGPIDDTLLANIVVHVSPYAIEPRVGGSDIAPWTSHHTRHLALDILSIPQISQPNISLLNQVLLTNLKPIFSANPHPYIDTTSGRKLKRPAGGPGASQDYYDEQTWKSYPGIWSVIAWVARSLSPDAYEDLWHLLIPPTMTLLDDYQAKHKLEGVEIISLMLHNIPKDLLQRTGVDELIFTSLKTALSHLTDPETPTLLRLSISAWLNLTLKVTQPGSPERFNHLCTLLGNRIIEGIWLYSDDNIVAMQSTIDALPDVIRALDIGTVRYLKSLIPQLAHLLATKKSYSSPPQLDPQVIELQKSAGRLLLVIMEVCSPRLEGWKFTILDCVARCWVGLFDSSTGAMDLELQDILKELMFRLVDVCSDISQNSYKALLMEDPSMFGGLVQGVPPPADHSQPSSTDGGGVDIGASPG